ncbi:MAG: GNAT family N-acetyltransferase [Chloroflexi bacterium]|nr:MAG: GNAT family N-acetyltransferase [Chloroflexota bacterium]
MGVKIGVVQRDEVTAVLALLAESGLPPEGLSEHLAATLVARDNGAIVGSAALELYGHAALLRSVAVTATHRGQGLGVRLSEAALELARQKRVTEVYLLTETAVSFFPKLGFQQVNRDEVPEAVQMSLEFTELCPDSAVAMALRLGE